MCGCGHGGKRDGEGWGDEGVGGVLLGQGSSRRFRTNFWTKKQIDVRGFTLVFCFSCVWLGSLECGAISLVCWQCLAIV
jgi:hypothetical protein